MVLFNDKPGVNYDPAPRIYKKRKKIRQETGNKRSNGGPQSFLLQSADRLTHPHQKSQEVELFHGEKI